MTGTFVLSFAVAVAIIGFLLWSRLAGRIATDIPNCRSLHDVPIPRVGGWGALPAALIAGTVIGGPDWLLTAIALSLFAVSYADDRKGLPIVVRLPMHAVAAALWLAFGPISLSLGVSALAVFAIVWVTNLFNFMDGADGLAGGMAVFAFSVYAAVAASAGIAPLALWSVAFAGAAAGFLLFNFNPSKIFLGDAGSVTLGFFAGAFGIWGWAADAWPVWFPFLVSAPFFLDATVTVLRRMARGEAFWRAHREHYYQRLIRSGWSHRRMALSEYALMAASSALAIAMLRWSVPLQYAALALAGLTYFGLAYAADRRWAAYQRLQSADSAAADADEAEEILATPILRPEARNTRGRSPATQRGLVGSEPNWIRFDESYSEVDNTGNRP